MKKICILQNDFVFGGTDTFVLNLSKGLIKDGYNVTVILSIDSQKKALRESELTDIGVRVLKTSSLQKSIYSKLKHLFLLYKILKKEKFDVFQTNIDLFNGPNLFVAWLARVPIRVCHSHNSEQEGKNPKNPVVFCYQKIMRILCWKFSNRRAGCSELALDFLFNNKWKEDSYTHVVHNGIDIKSFSEGINVELKLQEISANKKYNILTVGRISIQKNPIFLSKIFIELCKIRDDCDLFWVGIGNLQENVIKELKSANVYERVHFLGLRNDVNELMQCCDLFLFPSLFEGLGIVLVEAQSAGLPCVISDTIPKMVDCGGCYVNRLNDSRKKWAESINDILNKRIQLHIDENKLKEYSIENMVKQMEEIFE